jgi:hypothetical protein
MGEEAVISNEEAFGFFQFFFQKFSNSLSASMCQALCDSLSFQCQVT